MRYSASVKLRCWVIAILVMMALVPAYGAGKLRIADNHRYLEYADGTPFFYLGDTAWELFHRLNREEADRYLTNRASKGFTVIQAVAIAQFNGLTDPNPYGAVPLADKDPAKPNEAYFKHVDYIVDKANEVGLTIGMLPSWGSYWKAGTGIFTPENAKTYGRFLGRRYKDKSIIWVLGGDENIRNDTERATITAMAGPRWANAPQAPAITAPSWRERLASRAIPDPRGP